AAVVATGAAAAAGAVEAGAGILIVGAAVGFGGKLIRTVSFLGCTFAASVGLGGTAPDDGVFGMFSAIRFIQTQARVGASWCQMLIRGKLVAKENGPEENRPAEYIVLEPSISSVRDDHLRGHRGNHRRRRRRRHRRTGADAL